MKTRMWVALGLVVALTGAVAATAWAAEGEGPGLMRDRPLLKLLRQGRERFVEMLQQLNLTPEQKTRIGEILKGHKPEAVKLLREAREKHKVILAAVRADQVDEAAVRRAAADLTDTIAKGALLRAKVRQEVQAVLTPDQRRQVDEFIKSVDASIDQALTQLEAR